MKESEEFRDFVKLHHGFGQDETADALEHGIEWV